MDAKLNNLFNVIFNVKTVFFFFKGTLFLLKQYIVVNFLWLGYYLYCYKYECDYEDIF